MPSDPAMLPLDLHRPATAVAPDLVGCTLVRRWPEGQTWRGIIVETEAYEPGDPACHGYRRRTARNGTMFGPPGGCYVYLIYGIYHCLNIVTDGPDIPSAVLIRALALEGVPPWVDPAKERRPHRIAAGPGKLCRVLAIDRHLDGTPLAPDGPLWLEPRPPGPPPPLVQTTRIGLTQGVDLPWRWYWQDHPAVSKF